jgi:hypothetical protein
MKHETSLALYAYWQSCRRGFGVRAGGLRATELAPILTSLFLFDTPQSGDFRLRFCGAALATRYGRDLSDENFLSLWNAEDRDMLERNLRFSGPRSSGLVAGTMAETVGGGVISFEMLLLPLSGENRGAGIIGSMARVAGHEELNRIRARIVAHWVRSIRFLPEDEPRDAPLTFPAAHMLPVAPTRSRRRYRHLTVVSGGR